MRMNEGELRIVSEFTDMLEYIRMSRDATSQIIDRIKSESPELAQSIDAAMAEYEEHRGWSRIEVN